MTPIASATYPMPLVDRAHDALRILTLRMRRWSIGVLVGPSPFVLAAPAEGVNPVLESKDVTDVKAEFIADPFMIREGGAWHMFFEVFAIRGPRRKGEIGHAVSADGLRWEYQGIVLREPFHLSYPHVLRDGPAIYLVPECGASGGVRLYRAAPFPSRWELVGTLLSGQVVVDPSPFRSRGRWWMFAHSSAAEGTGSLRLFHSPALAGPWREHPRSPVVRSSRRLSRPAGRVITLGERVVRFAQDGEGGYGMRVHAVEVERLTADEYFEAECPGNPMLDGSGSGWNRSGMHHLDAHRLDDGSWIACADGWTNRPWDR